ncbi:hypothetical protein JW964_07250 [candidate division KSB1 bacterium]|nr:hypothetical protein [candidate division KSB1 bacterium]
MRKSSNKIQQLLVVILLFALIWANYSVLQFTHSHLDENGNIIVHSHPYSTNDQKGQPFPNHEHSKIEFTLLALIYQVLTLFILFVLFFNFFLRFNSRLNKIFNSQWNPVQSFCTKISRRGPPVIILFA